MDAPDNRPSRWAIEAAGLPVAFAQVREDPRIDAEVLAQCRPGATVVMVASGGETAVRLSRADVGRLVLADINPAQLAMCRLKFALAGLRKPEASRAILGHSPMAPEERVRHMTELMAGAGIPADAFGDVASLAGAGAAQAGRYERLFAAMRRGLAEPGATIGSVLSDVMREANLITLFGVGAVRNPRVPFDRHFAARFRSALAKPEADKNPFLNELLSGGFASGPAYDWLLDDSPPRVTPEYRRGDMTAVLRDLPEGVAEVVHLSNILDWLSPEDASACLAAAYHALKPGGRVIVRRLNSSLVIPELRSAFRWDEDRSRSSHARDRSFFYADIHIGTRP